MFERLFTRPSALARHRDAPLAEARRRFLARCAERGMTTRPLVRIANYLLAITRSLRLGDRNGESISPAEVEAAAVAWAHRRPRPRGMVTEQRTYRLFRSVATRWLTFLGRLQRPATAHAYARRAVDFAADQMDKGVTPKSAEVDRRIVQEFLDRLCRACRRMARVTPAHLDKTLSDWARERGLARATVRTYAGVLRAFWRYAARRGWCRPGLAESILAPRVFAQEAIPAGPSWDRVQSLLATTEGDRPADIRNRAILLLLSVYGLRSGEVVRLRLDELDWEHELIRLYRPKQRRTQLLPLSPAVGSAILCYLREVRPRSAHREVFLTLTKPVRPLHPSTLWDMVGPHLRSLNPALSHHGPHALRHACATHLLERGLSLKEIGDYLGHLCPDSTRLYAKVNLAGLRSVADFNLEELL